MGIIELLLLAVGLAMDAFAVSVVKGMSMKKIDWRDVFLLAAAFGFFQALMPVIGYVLGVRFLGFISEFDHWVAFILLAFIGGKMIVEAIRAGRKKESGEAIPVEYVRVGFGELLLLAIATSIDALAVGITFSVLSDVHIVFSVIIIGVITFALSLLGAILGHRFGDLFEKSAEIIGGVILILIGLKILLEHLGVISF